MVGFLWINETRRLLQVYSLVKITMKKGVFNIQLTERPSVGYGMRENHPYSGELDNRAKGIMIVNPGLLVKSFSDETSLVACDGTNMITLDAVDPFAINNINISCGRHKCPCAIPD